MQTAVRAAAIVALRPCAAERGGQFVPHVAALPGNPSPVKNS